MEIEGQEKQLPADGSSKEWAFSYFKFDKERDSPDQVRNTILVVAALVAAASYQAVMSPPDGLKQRARYTQLTFIYSNTLAWSSLITIIELLTVSFPFQRELRLAYFSMGSAYAIVVGELADMSFGLGYITLTACFFTPYLIRWISNYIAKITNKCRGK